LKIGGGCLGHRCANRKTQSARIDPSIRLELKIQRPSAGGEEEVQRRGDQEETNRPNPVHDAPCPVLIGEPAGGEEQGSHGTNDLAVDVQDLVCQFMHEMPNGRCPTLVRGLTTVCAVFATQLNPAVFASRSITLGWERCVDVSV
jgi:hypothetical protein